MFPFVSHGKRLPLSLFMKWDYKQWEIHQTSHIPFHWKRLKVALGKAVSASCSSNLATASVGGTVTEGWERFSILPGRVMCFPSVFLVFLAVLNVFFESILVVYREEKGEWGCFSCGTRLSGFSWWLILHSGSAKLNRLNVRMTRNCNPNMWLMIKHNT